MAAIRDSRHAHLGILRPARRGQHQQLAGGDDVDPVVGGPAQRLEAGQEPASQGQVVVPPRPAAGGVVHELAQLRIVARAPAHPGQRGGRAVELAGPQVEGGHADRRGLHGLALEEHLADGAAGGHRAERSPEQGRQPLLALDVGLGQPFDHRGRGPHGGRALQHVGDGGKVAQTVPGQGELAPGLEPGQQLVEPGQEDLVVWLEAVQDQQRGHHLGLRAAGGKQPRHQLRRSAQQGLLLAVDTTSALGPEVLGAIELEGVAEGGEDAVQVVVGPQVGTPPAKLLRVDGGERPQQVAEKLAAKQPPLGRSRRQRPIDLAGVGEVLLAGDGAQGHRFGAQPPGRLADGRRRAEAVGTAPGPGEQRGQKGEEGAATQGAGHDVEVYRPPRSDAICARALYI